MVPYEDEGALTDKYAIRAPHPNLIVEKIMGNNKDVTFQNQI